MQAACEPPALDADTSFRYGGSKAISKPRFLGRETMSKKIFGFAALLVILAVMLYLSGPTAEAEQNTAKDTAKSSDDGKLRIIAIGGHPDDCEIKAGGVAAMWAARGHHVKFVSVTNGDTGHWGMAGGELSRRRTKEAEKAARALGIEETQVLDNHTGELTATLKNRRKLLRLIREWKADIVLTHRPNDYHPDHRYTGILVQDTAYIVTVPMNCPDTPHLRKNPVYMYFRDRFEKPTPFKADVVAAIDEVIEQKIQAMLAMESQFIEGGVHGNESMVPKTKEQWAKARKRVRDRFTKRFAGIADKHRSQLIALYGEQKGKKIKYAEVFEICEYGRQPSAEELKKLFPFFGD